MIEINLELTYTLKFTEKDIKTIIIAVFKMMFMFKKTVSRNMDNIKKIQTEFQKMKTSMSEMKNIIDTMNRLDTSEQNINELKTQQQKLYNMYKEKKNGKHKQNTQ